jgi:hypothetical protein
MEDRHISYHRHAQETEAKTPTCVRTYLGLDSNRDPWIIQAYVAR